MRWGDYKIPPGRGSGGAYRQGVRLDVVDAVYIEDIYMQESACASPRESDSECAQTISSAQGGSAYVGYAVTPPKNVRTRRGGTRLPRKLS